jgi:hypothetical protein
MQMSVWCDSDHGFGLGWGWVAHALFEFPNQCETLMVIYPCKLYNLINNNVIAATYLPMPLFKPFSHFPVVKGCKHEYERDRG